MKNIKYNFLFFFAMALFIACEDDDTTNLIEPNHRAIVTSEMNYQNKVNVGGHIDFGDISQGVKSRTWTFPEGSSIVGETGNTSSKDVLKGIFNKVGVHNVTLSQVYNGNVYPNDDSTTPISGTELDTTIVVTVLGEVNITSLVANIVNPDGSLGEALTLSDNSKNKIQAGSTVRYSVTASGEPENYNWTFDGGFPESATEFVDEFEVKYKKLGIFDFAFSANRGRPEGSDITTLTQIIEVIPSTEPVTLDAVVEKNGGIGLNFSREMEFSTLNVDDFSVTVMNGGAEVPVVINSVSVDPVEGNIVVVEFENDMIYNDDTVTISYTAGSMTTTDAVAADSFTDMSVEFVKMNILDTAGWDTSFENSTASNWPDAGWGGTWGMFDFDVSTEQAFEGVNSGLIEMEAEGGMVIVHTDAGGQIPFTAEAGKIYEIGVWVYVDAVDAPDLADMFSPDLRFYWSPETNWGVGPNPSFEASNPNKPLQTWYYSSTFVEFPSNGEYTFTIRGYNSHNSTPTRVFIDNISVSEAVLRP